MTLGTIRLIWALISWDGFKVQLRGTLFGSLLFFSSQSQESVQYGVNADPNHRRSLDQNPNAPAKALEAA